MLPNPTMKQPPYCDENGKRVIAEKNTRIAELEAVLRDCDARLREHGDTTLHPLRDRIYRALGVPTVNK